MLGGTEHDPEKLKKKNIRVNVLVMVTDRLTPKVIREKSVKVLL